MNNNGHHRRHFEFAEFRLYPHERLLTRNEKRVALTPRILDLLIILVEHDGELVTKEQLLDSIWTDNFVEEGNVSRAVSTLRKNLGHQLNGSDFIETVPKLGYRFIAPIAEIIPDGTAPEPSSRSRVSFRRHLLVGGSVLAIVVATVLLAPYFVQRSVSNEDRKPAVDSMEAIKLTDDPKHDTIPRWTSDGRIRFWRVDEKTRQAESLIMNSDGTNPTLIKDSIGTWSPDGSKLVFAKPGDETGPYLANSDGSGEIAVPFLRGNFDWSGDSSKIVYQAKTDDRSAEIFVYSLETGKQENVTNHPAFDADPSFSPDGKQIVFASGRDGNAEIYLMNSDGANVRRLTNHPAWDNHPVFSPDGTQIAFPSDRENENSNVYVMNADGSNIRRLTDWPANETVEPGCWSPDGTRIAFYSDRDGNDDIFVINAEVSRPTFVFGDEANNISFPSYSPDGTQIVYQAEMPDKSGELRVFDVTNRQARVLLKTQNADIAPLFSPDGTKIIFQNKIESNTEICSIDLDGGGLQNLTNNGARDGGPAYSPDGSQIAFSTNRDGNTGKYNLYVMNADGSEQRQVYSAPAGMSGSVAWSPDRTSVIFANDFAEDGNFEIFEVRLGGNEAARRLTFRRLADDRPSISPNGRRIAFASNTDGNWELYLMNADGTGQLRLTRNRANDSMPHFSPDGKKIIFSSDRGGKYALYEIETPE
ncbi:MAG: winged helix-turn-helix domain-containing protein [Pyrinomonadaceae bacterium]